MLKKLVLSALVFSVGAVFALNGLFLLCSTQDPIGIRLWGMVPAVLGVLLLVCLSLVWLRPNPQIISVANWVSIAFVILFLVGSFDHGIVSGLELAATFVIGVTLALACWCLRILARSGVAADEAK